MDVKLPRLGEGAESGTVVTVLVKVGDQVKKDQPILEMENEKAVASIPSSGAGKVSAIHVKAGDKVSVGQRLISIEGSGAAAAEPARQDAPRRAAVPQAAPAAEPAEEPAAYESKSGVPPPASPSVRKVAREVGIDLTKVRGTEPGGRISMGDLKAYVQYLQQAAQRGAASRAGEPAAPARPAPVSVDFSKWGPVERKPMTSLRQAISKKMTASWTAIPHVTQFDDADLTTVLGFKKTYEAAYVKRGVKLTPTVFVLSALIDTLKKHPQFNASLDEAAGEIVHKRYYHLGIAVDTEAGLIVPVLRDADTKSLADLSKGVQELAEKTRNRTIAAEDLQGGTFTVSNQGGIGGAHFTPVINTPEVAILGIGQARPRAVARDGKLEVRTLLPLGLSYDHRVLDGANAARFITDLVQAIEQFPEAKVKL